MKRYRSLALVSLRVAILALEFDTFAVVMYGFVDSWSLGTLLVPYTYILCLLISSDAGQGRTEETHALGLCRIEKHNNSRTTLRASVAQQDHAGGRVGASYTYTYNSNNNYYNANNNDNHNNLDNDNNNTKQQTTTQTTTHTITTTSLP